VEFYEKKLESLRSSKYTINNIVGKSESIVESKRLALRAAQTNAPVIIIGESGTGKELFAHAIHYGSERRPRPQEADQRTLHLPVYSQWRQYPLSGPSGGGQDPFGSGLGD
jgi:hypothetical protein